MEPKEKLDLLQLLHTGLLVDILELYEKLNILELRTTINESEQRLAAEARVQQFGLTNPEDVFNLFSEIFGFVNWYKVINDKLFYWKADECKLCAVAIKQGTVQPCRLFCIDPMKALCRALQPAFKITVESTLWDSSSCSFMVHEQIDKIW